MRDKTSLEVSSVIDVVNKKRDLCASLDYAIRKTGRDSGIYKRETEKGGLKKKRGRR